jgi:hypothetical protein
MALPTGLTVQSTPNVYDFAAAITVATPFSLCRAIYVGTGGTSMTVTMGNGDSIVINNPASGDLIPIRCTNVSVVAGLVANLVALY